MGAPLRISSVRDELDVAMIHRYLSEISYWKRGVALETVRKGIENALCFGGYVNARQVAYARVVTDYTDFAYLRDVFVLPAYQGRGYGRQLVAAVLGDERLRNVGWMLATDDAHALYAGFGFAPLDAPHKYMRRPAPWKLSKQPLCVKKTINIIIYNNVALIMTSCHYSRSAAFAERSSAVLCASP